MKKYNKKLYSNNPEFEDLVTKLVFHTFGIGFKMQTWKAANTFLCNLIQYGSIQKYEKEGSNLHKIMKTMSYHGYLVIEKLHGQYTKYVISKTDKFDSVFGV